VQSLQPSSEVEYHDDACGLAGGAEGHAHPPRKILGHANLTRLDFASARRAHMAPCADLSAVAQVTRRRVTASANRSSPISR